MEVRVIISVGHQGAPTVGKECSAPAGAPGCRLAYGQAVAGCVDGWLRRGGKGAGSTVVVWAWVVLVVVDGDAGRTKLSIPTGFSSGWFAAGPAFLGAVCCSVWTGDALNAAISAYLQARAPFPADPAAENGSVRRVIAVDGKVARGARTATAAAIPLAAMALST